MSGHRGQLCKFQATCESPAPCAERQPVATRVSARRSAQKTGSAQAEVGKVQRIRQKEWALADTIERLIKAKASSNHELSM
mmetsp:Transcript_66144/g.153619  ORF Transcript_66144/g.153619 Transcript_66144/m.153619 type:complete len:81 (-) Transcript_66144:42-284(-)